jgi:hypothetical protein
LIPGASVTPTFPGLPHRQADRQSTGSRQGPGASASGARGRGCVRASGSRTVRGEDPRDRKAVNDSQDSSAPRITRPHPRCGTARSDRVPMRQPNHRLVTRAGGTSGQRRPHDDAGQQPEDDDGATEFEVSRRSGCTLAGASCQRRIAADGSLADECPICAQSES